MIIWMPDGEQEKLDLFLALQEGAKRFLQRSTDEKYRYEQLMFFVQLETFLEEDLAHRLYELAPNAQLFEEARKLHLLLREYYENHSYIDH